MEFNGGRSQEEEKLRDEFIESLRIIVRRVGGDFRMEVKLGQLGFGSFFDPKNLFILLLFFVPD